MLPANQAGRIIEPAALDELVRLTTGYPYFVQLYGRELWDLAEGNAIVVADVAKAHEAAMAVLDHGPYGSSWRGLRPSEQRFIAAMAAVEAHPAPLSQVTEPLGLTAKTASSLRQRLIDSGLVEPAGHGLLSFVWPGYRDYVRARHPLAVASASRPLSVGDRLDASPMRPDTPEATASGKVAAGFQMGSPARSQRGRVG